MPRAVPDPPNCPECQRTLYVEPAELVMVCAHTVSHFYHLISLARVSLQSGERSVGRRLLQRFWASRARRYMVSALAAIPVLGRCVDASKKDVAEYYLHREMETMDTAHEDLDRALPNAGAYIDEVMLNLQ